MKVAIDTGPLTSGHQVRGIGVHTRELLQALKKVESKGVKIEGVDFSKTDLSTYDVVHYQYFHPFFSNLPPIKPASRVVVTIHDLIQLIYSDKYPPGIKGKINFLKQKKRLRYADAIITISETSKKDICRFLGVDPKKVHVIHLAPKGIFKKLEPGKWKSDMKEKYNLPEKFALYVGDVNYNKNIPTLIKACQKTGMKLVICGKQAGEVESFGLGLDVLGGPMDWLRFLFNIPHPENMHYEELVKLFGKNGKVTRLGFVPDKDLVKIFNLASVYIQPSFYEGYGLPILEAQASGTLVVAARNNAHVEVAGKFAIYFNPKNVNDLVARLKAIGRDGGKGEMVKRGVENAKKNSWQKTAKETIKVYKELS